VDILRGAKHFSGVLHLRYFSTAGFMMQSQTEELRDTERQCDLNDIVASKAENKNIESISETLVRFPPHVLGSYLDGMSQSLWISSRGSIRDGLEYPTDSRQYRYSTTSSTTDKHMSEAARTQGWARLWWVMPLVRNRSSVVPRASVERATDSVMKSESSSSEGSRGSTYSCNHKFTRPPV